MDFSKLSINPFAGSIGGASAGGVSGYQGPVEAGGATGGQKTGGSIFQKELDDVSLIGANKRAGFENGLGGTNNPDDHKLFCIA